MIPVSREITDLKGEFEGGTALSLNWYDKLRQGAENLLDNVNPETLKRRVAIYGGLTEGWSIYYCPEDVLVPSAIYHQVNDRKPWYVHVPASIFYQQNKPNTFTIEYINKKRFIVIKNANTPQFLVIDEMDDSSGFGGNVTLTENEFNFISGNAALQGTFSDTLTTVTKTFETAKDISSYLNGAITLPVTWPSASKVSSVVLRLKESSTKYYTLTSASDSVGDNFIDGFNMIRFWMANATTTLSPNPQNINSWELVITMTSGQSQVVIIDKINLHKSAYGYFEYYSNRAFVDGTTGAFKETPAVGDYINLDRDLAPALHWETVLRVAASSTYVNVSEKEIKNFREQLANKYQTYWANHPSSEQPLSYNREDELAGNDPFLWGDKIGDSISAEVNPLFGVVFADNETPGGTFDGANTVFTLAHAPNPAASLILILNGQYLTAGTDYNLSNTTITFVEAPSALFDGLPFRASYRYSTI